MTGNEHVTAELSWLRRRSVGAAPERHPLRTPQCPPLGALAEDRLSDEQRRHVARCRHCRGVQRADAETRTAPAAAAIAAALVMGALLAGWRHPAPERFAAPRLEAVQPAPRAVEAQWPAPLRLRPPGVRLPAPEPALPLPVIRPLERFHPPERTTTPMPVAALNAPGAPALAPEPAPDVVALLGLRVL
jgi:hypothetical protein